MEPRAQVGSECWCSEGDECKETQVEGSQLMGVVAVDIAREGWLHDLVDGERKVTQEGRCHEGWRPLLHLLCDQ